MGWRGVLPWPVPTHRRWTHGVAAGADVGLQLVCGRSALLVLARRRSACPGLDCVDVPRTFAIFWAQFEGIRGARACVLRDSSSNEKHARRLRLRRMPPAMRSISGNPMSTTLATALSDFFVASCAREWYSENAICRRNVTPYAVASTSPQSQARTHLYTGWQRRFRGKGCLPSRQRALRPRRRRPCRWCGLSRSRPACPPRRRRRRT